ncbi:MAG: hypothetical protein V9F82_07745 [Dermatophilaceae bacterium]
MREIKQRYNYIIDPHGAVGYLALRKYQETHPGHLGVVLETAHPSKFIEDVESILEQPIEVPERLQVLSNAEKHSVRMSTNYADFKSWLLEAFLMFHVEH